MWHRMIALGKADLCVTAYDAQWELPKCRSHVEEMSIIKYMLEVMVRVLGARQCAARDARLVPIDDIASLRRQRLVARNR
jgi:hypothetical protein